jgi:putative transposase
LRNLESRVTVHLWANRFFSTALDEPHLWVAVRYVELNPVRAGLVGDAMDYLRSSAMAHANLRTDRLLDPERPFPGPIGDWASWLRTCLEARVAGTLRANTATGRPTGSDGFVSEIEARLDRRLRVRPRGHRRRQGTV